MGVLGADGEPDIKPLGQKKAALMKDAERKARKDQEQEEDRIRTIADSISKKAYDAAQAARKEYFDANPRFDPEKDFKQNGLTAREQEAIHNMKRNSQAGRLADAAAQRIREQEAEKLPEKDRWLSGAKKYQWKFSAPVQEPKPVTKEIPSKNAKKAKTNPKGKRSAEASLSIPGGVKAKNGTWTGSAETDARLQQYRARGGKGMTAAEEKALKLYEARAKADPAKWKAGDGVGYRVDGNQINRGFRVVSVDPETKTAVVRQVADTGITVTGGADRLSDTRIHIGELVRDNKYKK
jgi:hypothetical protein